MEESPYNFAAIRDLLAAAYRVQDLRSFCQDRPLFRPILRRFGPGQDLEDMVQTIIDYCDTQLLFDELLSEIRADNPRQYARFEPYVRREPANEEIKPDQKVAQATEPGRRPEVFLAYSSQDQARAQDLRGSLEQAGIRVWRDIERLKAGAFFSLELEQAIRRADALIVLITAAARTSQWVHNELLFAQDIKKPIIPLMMEADITPPLAIYGLQHIALHADWDAGIRTLADRLREIATTEPPAVPTAQPVGEIEAAKQAQPKVRSGDDPFLYGPAVPSDLFVGRRQELETICAYVFNYYELQSLSVVANRRMGKTSLLRYIWKECQTAMPTHHAYAAVYLDASEGRAQTVEGVMRILRRGIKQQLGYELWTEKDDGSLRLLAEAFEELAKSENARLILLLDEWESVMTYRELDPLLYTLRSIGSRGWAGMITSTAHPLFDLEKEGGFVSGFYNIFGQMVYLGNMPRPEWEELIDKGFERAGRTADWRDHELVGQLAGGHPYLTQLAGSLLWKAQRQRWSEAQVREQFKLQARMIFSGIWQRLSARQISAVLSALGLAVEAPAPESVVNELKLRGVLAESGQVFSEAFGDYVLGETMQ
jgi:hypothetical protein